MGGNEVMEETAMSMNRVFLVGRLGAAPELRYTAGGKAVCKLSIATNRQGAGGKEAVDWHPVVVWEKQAESCHAYLDKGRLVAVEGRLNYRKWEKPEGQKHFATEIVAHRVIFLGSKGQGEPSDGGSQAGPRKHGAGESANDALPF